MDVLATVGVAALWHLHVCVCVHWYARVYTHMHMTACLHLCADVWCLCVMLVQRMLLRVLQGSCGVRILQDGIVLVHVFESITSSCGQANIEIAGSHT